MADQATATPRWGNEGRGRKAAAILQTLRAGAPDVAAGRWLDVGCGSGGIAAALAEETAHVTGIDPEPWPEWQPAMAAHPNLDLRVGGFDASKPPLPDATFDVVVCNQVYEHVADPARLIANLARVMRPGATCYFAGPNLLWPIEPHVFWPFVHWLPRGVAQAAMRALGSRRAGELDAYSATSWRLRSWFRAAGFVVQPALAARAGAEVRLRGAPRIAACIERIPQWLQRAAEPFAPGHVYLLRKMAGGR
jgi:SAM-dependent methyltransferase